MAIKVMKTRRGGVSYYELRGVLPNGDSYVECIGFSDREMMFRQTVAAMVRQLKANYRAECESVSRRVSSPTSLMRLIF